MAIGPVIGRPRARIQAAAHRRLANGVAIVKAKLARQGLQRVVIGSRVGGEAPGKQIQLAVAVQGDEDPAGSHRHGVGQRWAALVGEQRGHLRLDGLGLGFGDPGGAAVNLVTGVVAGTAAAPLKTAVAVEIRAKLVPQRGRIVTRAAVGVVDVLALVIAGLGHLAAIGVGLRHDHHFKVVEQPGDIGVEAVLADQILGETRGDLGRGVLASVDGGHQKENGLGTGLRFVGQHQDIQVVAGRTAAGYFPPTFADGDPTGQVGMATGQLRQAGVGLFDGAVTRKTGDAAGLVLQGLGRVVEQRRASVVNLHPMAGGD